MDSNIENNVKVSVIMPVYNCEAYIKEAIDSILNQTFTYFEFIIIDDCSSDNTVEIIKKYTDSRIKIITKEVNKGISDSLNYGISIAKGKYIARMDGDDISFLNRFEKQVKFLEKNKEITVCGTGFNVIGGRSTNFFPEKNDRIKLAMLKRNSLLHPSVMMRKEAFTKKNILYNAKMEPAEDYDLWIRLLATEKLYNLKEVLLNYRSHQNQVTEKNISKRLSKAFEVKLKLLSHLDFKFNEDEKKTYQKITEDPKNISFNILKRFLRLKNKLLNSNSTNFFEPILFNNFFQSMEDEVFKNYFIRRKKYSPIIFFQFWSVKEMFSFKINYMNQLKLFIKSLSFFKK